MPKHTFKAKSFDEEFGISDEEKHLPSISFPLSKEQFAEAEVGTEVEVIFQGKVTTLDVSEERRDVTIELEKSDFYRTGEFSEMSREEEADS